MLASCLTVGKCSLLWIGLIGCQGMPVSLDPNHTAPSNEAAAGRPAGLLAEGVPVLASSVAGKGVSLQLAASRTAFEPGRPLTLGLILRHDPGFHTYWRFPGVVGLATRIRWNLPPGFRAGPLRWARPERSKMGVYQVWGYQREVALLTEITPPADLQAGQLVEISADAVWMACARSCHPGFGEFRLLVPVAAQAEDRQVRALFETMRRESARYSAAWRFHAERLDSGLLLVATPQAEAAVPPPGVADAYLFNSNSLIDSDRGQQFTRTPGGGFTLTLADWEHAETAVTLEGVLTSRQPLNSAGARAILVTAPIR